MGRGQVRPTSRPRGRACQSEGEYHRRHRSAGYPGGKASDRNHPHRDGDILGPRGDWLRRQPRSPWGEHHRFVRDGTGASREAIGAAQGGRSQGVPRGPSGNPANPGTAPMVRRAQDAARTLGIRLQLLEARSPGEIDSAFAAMTRERAGALLVLLDVMFADHRARIADLAAKHRLPAVYGLQEFAEVGGLMVYGSSFVDRFRRAATSSTRSSRGRSPLTCPSSSRPRSSWRSTLGRRRRSG